MEEMKEKNVVIFEKKYNYVSEKSVEILDQLLDSLMVPKHTIINYEELEKT